MSRQELNKEIVQEDARRAALNQPIKEVRFFTKGRFPEAHIPTAAEAYLQDVKWMQKANPEATLADREYLEKDRLLLVKRRQ